MDYYEVLGVQPGTSQEEIEKSYRSIAKKLHPDQHPVEKRPEYEAKMKELNEAYTVLKDPEKRKAYSSGNEAGRTSYPYEQSGYPFQGRIIVTTVNGSSCLLSAVLLVLSLFLFKYWGIPIWLMVNYLLFLKKSRA